MPLQAQIDHEGPPRFGFFGLIGIKCGGVVLDEFLFFVVSKSLTPLQRFASCMHPNAVNIDWNVE